MTLLLTPAATRFLAEMQLTAARAAMQGKVDFIGIEREPEYLEIAKARIGSVVRQEVLL